MSNGVRGTSWEARTSWLKNEIFNSTSGVLNFSWDGNFEDEDGILKRDIPLVLNIISRKDASEVGIELNIPLEQFIYPWYDREPKAFIDPRHNNYLSYEEATFDYEKFKKDTKNLVEFRYSDTEGTQAQIASTKGKFIEFYLMHWSEYMYAKGVREISELSSSQKEQLRVDFRNYWKNHTFKHGETSLIYHAIRDELWEQKHEKFLRELEAEAALKAAIEDRKMAVIKEAVITTGSIAISIWLFPASGGSSAWLITQRFAAGASMFASGSSIKGNYDEYMDLDNKIFKPNRIYDPIKGYFVSVEGSEEAVIYDMVTILASIIGGNLEDARVLYDRLAKVGSINESQIKTFLRAVSLGNTTVNIKNVSIELTR